MTSPHFPGSPKLVVLVLGSWTFKHRLRFLAVELAGLYGTRLDANKAGTGSLLVRYAQTAVGDEAVFKYV